ncbi:MAG: 2Fe-2S iron-sulfur cluster-binding protein [Porticoccaceae bacterium]
MVQITFIDAAGNRREVEAETGVSLMQVALDNGVEGIVAECGGACSCATCHCYVEEVWLDKVTAPSDIEKDMLEFVVAPQDNSRLSCQIVVDDSLEGLVVNVPSAQY